LAVFAVALGGAASPSDVSGASGSGCSAGRRTVLFRNETGIVTRNRASGQTFACTFASGRSRAIDDPAEDEAQRPFDIAGKYAAFVDYQAAPDVETSYAVRVINLDLQIHHHSYVVSSEGAPDRTVHELIAKRSGRVAWIDCRPIDADRRCVTSPGRRRLIRRVMLNGRELQIGSRIELGSLRLSADRRRIVWLDGGRRHSATF
jgi:hypothetical protein